MISNKTLDQPDSVEFVVLDQAIVDTLRSAPLIQNQFGQTLAEGKFATGETIADLATALGLDPDALAESLAAVNGGASGGPSATPSRRRFTGRKSNCGSSVPGPASASPSTPGSSAPTARRSRNCSPSATPPRAWRAADRKPTSPAWT